MKKSSKKSKMRDLLCFAIENLLSNNLLNLDESDSEKYRIIRTTLLGKDSVILLTEYTHKELCVTLLWGYKKEEAPIIVNNQPPILSPSKDYADTICFGFLERKTGKWLQGKGEKGISSTYCSKQAVASLMDIPEANPILFQKDGAWKN